MIKPAAAIGAAVGLAVVAAGGVGYWLAARTRPELPPAIILPAPMAPPTVASQTLPPEPIAEPVEPPATSRRIPVASSRKVSTTRPAPATEIPARPAQPTAEPAHVPVHVPVGAPAHVPAPVAAVAHKPEPSAPPVPASEPRPARNVTIPAGTLITVRLTEELSSQHNTEGDAFSATLDQPLVVEGLVIAERGSRQQGRVLASERAGRVKGRASIQLALAKLHTADGQVVDVQTDAFTHAAQSSVKKDVAKAGVAAAIGAAIGAIAGGGKSAAIGAGIGGAAGTGGVLATRGDDAELRAETRISFRLSRPVTLTEKLN